MLSQSKQPRSYMSAPLAHPRSFPFHLPWPCRSSRHTLLWALWAVLRVPGCTPQESLSPHCAACALSCHQPHSWPTVAVISWKNNHPMLRITHHHSPAAVVPTPALAHGQEILRAEGLVQMQPSASLRAGRALLPQVCCEGISPKCRGPVPSHLNTQYPGMRLLPAPSSSHRFSFGSIPKLPSGISEAGQDWL